MNATTRTTPLGLTAAALLVVAGHMADAQETPQGNAAQIEPNPIEFPEIELPESDARMGKVGEDELTGDESVQEESAQGELAQGEPIDEDSTGDESTGSEQPSEVVLDRHYEVNPADDDYPDGIDDAGAGAGTAELEEESPQEQLQRYFLLYKEALESKAYLEADTLAKRVVELSIELFGVNSVDSARALTNLGIAQHQNDNYDAAILNYNAAIDIIERVEDRLNSNLINPLKGRGAAELASGQPDKAVESFERAVHISHVNEGPHNLEQVEILESLAETFLSVGELDDVEDIQAHIFSLEARDVELDTLEAIPALERQARWQHRLQFFEKERYTWRKIIEIIEERRGEDDLSLIAPLTDLGKSYLYVGQPSMAFHQPSSVSSGEIYLKRALRIAESNPDATWKTKEETMLALGDFYILSGKPGRAEKIYADTWQLLSGDEEKLKDRHDHLETLVRLVDAQPPMYVGIDGEVRSDLPGDTYQTGKIVYDYSVSSRGLTTGIDMVEAEPAGFEDMERAVLNNLRAMMHRPRLVEGSAVQTDDLVYTHKFFYRESDLVEMQKEADLAATN
jgi:tetratricopeptide (TPR) repeat protein